MTLQARPACDADQSRRSEAKPRSRWARLQNPAPADGATVPAFGTPSCEL